MQAQINPFLSSHCLAEDLSPEWGWAYPTPVGINHIPPPQIPLSICSQLLLGSLPSPPTAKTAAAINNVQTLSIAHLSSHLASYHTHPCYAKQKGILAPATSRWRMDKGTSKIDRKQEIDYKQAGDRKRVFSDTSVQTKGDLPFRSNRCKSAFPEGPFWAMLHEIPQSLILSLLPSSFVFISTALPQALSTNTKSDL